MTDVQKYIEANTVQRTDDPRGRVMGIPPARDLGLVDDDNTEDLRRKYPAAPTANHDVYTPTVRTRGTCRGASETVSLQLLGDLLNNGAALPHVCQTAPGV